MLVSKNRVAAAIGNANDEADGNRLCWVRVPMTPISKRIFMIFFRYEETTNEAQPWLKLHLKWFVKPHVDIG